MGVDIYGRKPELKKKEPQRPENFEELTRIEQAPFYEEMDQFLNNNPGAYFRNNWWHWRPLQYMIGYFDDIDDDMNIPVEEIAAINENSGKGVSSDETCKKLAKSFREFIEMMEEKGHKHLYVNTNCWEYQSLSPAGEMKRTTIFQEPTEWEAKAIKALNETLSDKPYFFEKPTYDNVEFSSSHETNIDNIKDFTDFLENCGGFKVY